MGHRFLPTQVLGHRFLCTFLILTEILQSFLDLKITDSKVGTRIEHGLGGSEHPLVEPRSLRFSTLIDDSTSLEICPSVDSRQSLLTGECTRRVQLVVCVKIPACS